MILLKGALESDRPLRVLCLGAHADDIEIGCGGTILSLARREPAAEFCWVVFSGDKTRAAEARSSVGRFLAGVRDPTIIVRDFRDGFFPAVYDSVKEFFETDVRSFEPDVVFTHYREDRHQDHRVVSDLTWNTFRDHLVLEYEIVKYDGDLGRPSFYVPLERELCRDKVGMIMDGFPTQRGKHWFTADTFESILRIRGVECRSSTGLAEAFHVRKAVLTLDGSHK